MTRRLSICVRGVVQGVGFRPFVYRTALDLGLSGWVKNRSDGVRLEVQGPGAAVERFVEALRTQAPPQAAVEHLDVEEVPVSSSEGFAILESEAAAARPSVPADLATCPECLAEIADPAQRRFRYPFTNCTRCGPRYSIIESLPYDRPRTAMKGFLFCPECAREYRDPLDRRFHAQPIACPACGPQLELLDARGQRIAQGDDALRAAARSVREGRIVALKGLGGFQLLADATSDAAVLRLRERKRRGAKPLAVMFPSLEALRSACEVSPEEESALTSPQAPILLLRRRAGDAIAPSAAPGNPRLGALLPYTPLHRLLLDAIGRPAICTSGNLSDEPMATETAEALRRLGGIADLFLAHDRSIARPVDDSVARLDASGPTLLRRARGFAPLPLPFPDGPSVLAVGAHLKCTVALSVGDQVVLSQHLGDLDSAEGAALHERTIEDLTRFFEVRPAAVACDLHPEYASSRLAERLARRWGVPLVRVQHHHAHVAAVMAEHAVEGEVLGLAWDGTGFGEDGAFWGGEALLCGGAGFRRLAPLRAFPLPGGDLAAREPRRSALGVLWALLGPEARGRVEGWFTKTELELLLAALSRGQHAPPSTSLGRLFDAASALCGLRARQSFEGQAAMELEFAAEGLETDEAYPFPVSAGCADWGPLFHALLEDVAGGVPTARTSARFHNALAELALSWAQRAGVRRVALSGGCFQNARLTGRCAARLRSGGFEVLCPRRVPPNDGALALGQALVAARRLANREDANISPG